MGDAFASVILEVSVGKTLDYIIPEPLRGHVVRGSLVEVPLRGKLNRGYVECVKPESAFAKVLPIQRLIGSTPPLTEDLFAIALWMAKYYICPLGRVIKTMLPAGVRENVELKEQYYVMRAVTRDEMRNRIPEIRQRAPQQAEILEVMLQVKKGILHSELLEKANAPASSVKSLVEKGMLLIDIVRSDRSPLIGQEYFQAKPKELRDEQKAALDAVKEALSAKKFETHLLFGVTGSGKTEVYMQAIDMTLKQGRQVIVLVPEIALTEQTIERFKSRFSCPIAVLHHRLSQGERAHSWERMRRGEMPIVIGARSAIFSPMPALGLIIVDEEHEHSYKSDESPHYSARDVAIMRGLQNNAVVLLGSATPQLESYHNALQGKYKLHKLTNRGTASLPAVITVDMKREFEKNKGPTTFSDLLLSKIEERKKKGEQTILFLNRRGYHTLLSCQSCGNPIICPHCDAKVTFHRLKQTVACHLCGLETKPPEMCPECHATQMIKYQGVGTEKVEVMLKAIFPELRTLRVDADTTRHKGSLEMLLQDFRSGKAELMIGTQMIAKGLHFPEVTLVGVLNADASLNIPDFRAQEQVFQLITQVAGRAGRGFAPGEVIVQTLLPEHSVIQHATKQDYEAFYKEECETRKLFDFPPYSRLAKFRFTGPDEQEVQKNALLYLEALKKELPETFVCHPVLPCGHVKIKDQYRYQFLVRGAVAGPVQRAVEKVERELKLPSTIVKSIDIDPSSIFF